MKLKNDLNHNAHKYYLLLVYVQKFKLIKVKSF